MADEGYDWELVGVRIRKEQRVEVGGGQHPAQLIRNPFQDEREPVPDTE
jgi:hypothetical protein